jgi:hypothetical protein
VACLDQPDRFPGLRGGFPARLEPGQQQASQSADPLLGGRRPQLRHGLPEVAWPYLIGWRHLADELGHRQVDERASRAGEERDVHLVDQATEP